MWKVKDEQLEIRKLECDDQYFAERANAATITTTRDIAKLAVLLTILRSSCRKRPRIVCDKRLEKDHLEHWPSPAVYMEAVFHKMEIFFLP